MHTRAHLRTSSALLLTASAALLAGCSGDPSSAPRHYALADATVTELADYPDVQAQILGSLDMLFGTPTDPRFMLVADWADEGYDPNWPWYAEDDGGSGEFDDATVEAIVAGNRERFAADLAAIDDERYEDVGPFRHAPRLQRNWELLLADRDEFDDFQEEARRTFEEYYPSLNDSAELYRQQCLHCHGNEGGGDGPTAQFLNPLPRDYRHGVFKFTALKDKARPRRSDLYNILVNGVYGTAMPNFRRFSDAELHGLVDYVRLLAIRGEVERLLLANFASEEPLTPALVTETYLDVWADWADADDAYIAFDGDIPAPTPEMLARGKELFNDAAKGNCASCHDERGTGKGASAFKIEDGQKVAAYADDWGHPIYPRDLTRGVFRGGRRPIDIYRRVYAGINGTPMPAIGEARTAEGDLLMPPEDMWSLVHYVRSLSETPDKLGLDPYPLLGHDEQRALHASAGDGHGEAAAAPTAAEGH